MQLQDFGPTQSLIQLTPVRGFPWELKLLIMRRLQKNLI